MKHACMSTHCVYVLSIGYDYVVLVYEERLNMVVHPNSKSDMCLYGKVINGRCMGGDV